MSVLVRAAGQTLRHHGGRAVGDDGLGRSGSTPAPRKRWARRPAGLSLRSHEAGQARGRPVSPITRRAREPTHDSLSRISAQQRSGGLGPSWPTDHGGRPVTKVGGLRDPPTMLQHCCWQCWGALRARTLARPSAGLQPSPESPPIPPSGGRPLPIPEDPDQRPPPYWGVGGGGGSRNVCQATRRAAALPPPLPPSVRLAAVREPSGRCRSVCGRAAAKPGAGRRAARLPHGLGCPQSARGITGRARGRRAATWPASSATDSDRNVTRAAVAGATPATDSECPRPAR
jgi:hypothetical protein